MTKIIFYGSTSLSAIILQKLIDADYEIGAVITRADQPVGRKKLMTPTPVALVALKYSLKLFKPHKLNPEFIETNRADLQADLGVIAAYGKIIPQALLDIPVRGNLNVHGSILPKYRGASPIQAAILNGEKTTGVTIMLVDAQMDHGPILSLEEMPIAEDETFETLEAKMAEVGGKLLLETIPGFLNGTIRPIEQKHDEATYTKIISKEDGFFEIDSPPSPEQLDRMIRAYFPWPNVWTIWRVEGRGPRAEKVVKFYPGDRMQMEGKKIVSKEEFLRGYPEFPIK